MFTQDLFEELNILSLYNLESMQEGIKIHSTASPAMVAAAARLFEKGITSQIDGGYLTLRGQEAAEHVKAVLGLLSSPHRADT